MATQTHTQTATAVQHKDSMKSTWRQDKSQWGIFHYLTVFVQGSTPATEKPPVHAKSDKVPHVKGWTTHRHVLLSAFLPLLIHQAYCWQTGNNFSWGFSCVYYILSFQLIGIHLLHQLRKMGMQYGHLDGDKHPRDDVPDHKVRQVFLSLINTAAWRSVLALMLAYDSSKRPMDASWMWLPLEQGLYGIILDFWFYWYHRVMHESDFLWKFHRTHHLTKHPNPLLTLYADGVQEVFDIAGIPFMTYLTMRLMGLPMGFYEWWICTHYVVFAELSGHSGLRLHALPPSTLSWLLELFKCELVIEDHDLHHRRGYKKSGNYGKQTRLWDTIFGTLLPRIECVPDNVDYDNAILHPVL